MLPITIYSHFFVLFLFWFFCNSRFFCFVGCAFDEKCLCNFTFSLKLLKVTINDGMQPSAEEKWLRNCNSYFRFWVKCIFSFAGLFAVFLSIYCYLFWKRNWIVSNEICILDCIISENMYLQCGCMMYIKNIPNQWNEHFKFNFNECFKPNWHDHTQTTEHMIRGAFKFNCCHLLAEKWSTENW